MISPNTRIFVDDDAVRAVRQLAIDEERVGRAVDVAVLDVDVRAGQLLGEVVARGLFILGRNGDIGQMDDLGTVDAFDDDRAAVDHFGKARHRNGGHQRLRENNERHAKNETFHSFLRGAGKTESQPRRKAVSVGGGTLNTRVRQCATVCRGGRGSAV